MFMLDPISHSETVRGDRENKRLKCYLSKNITHDRSSSHPSVGRGMITLSHLRWDTPSSRIIYFPKNMPNSFRCRLNERNKWKSRPQFMRAITGLRIRWIGQIKTCWWCYRKGQESKSSRA